MRRTVRSAHSAGADELRRRYVPVGSVLVAALAAWLPIVTPAPIFPDLAFLVLLAWRLLRPEIWTAPAALPLGLFNDIVAGHPVGQSMLLWTLLFLILDVVDARLAWRDHWMDWLVGAAAIFFYISGSWWIARAMGGSLDYLVMMPQLLVSLLAFPVVMRTALGLDRWRLSR
jgi:rod shape-determining protein MreD